ncbi:hypothetical protein E4U09_000694 [Claviceps aff. purpurea]|uniref:Uncharacterized protein n=1 Tax=Claviceps aff. purpurea TaxID=1967640 RepID=A0A9P7U9S1_9HYPO|nr:hypothetical protein E4U09_000694 [Claviceps aff. purpurea]
MASLPPDDDTLPSLSSLLSSLKRSTLSIHNRLTSIHSDAQFVLRAASSPSLRGRASKPRPLVANQRCGSWYVPPGKTPQRACAYFKSTDGHERAWKCSTRRLNMHLVDMIEEHDGIIIVDSTRRGKRMPDALSTTIPIWCTVLNNLLLPSHPLSSQLFLPPHLMASTHAQIMALIPGFVQALRDLKLEALPVLTKPLRPFWVTQESSLLPPEDDDDNKNNDNNNNNNDIDDSKDSPQHQQQGQEQQQQQAHEQEQQQEQEQQGTIFQDYHPIICLTASRRILTSEIDSQGYIQGAADDTENWAHGLTPDLFWAHSESLLSTPDAQLPELIASLLERDQMERREQQSVDLVRLTSVISVCALPLGAPGRTDGEVCHVVLVEGVTPKDTWIRAPNYMEIGLGKHKTASRNLRLALPEICAFVRAFLERGQDRQVVVACESGRDTSVGTALALSCYLFDEQGQFRVPDARLFFTKGQVKVKLASFMTAYPAGNPSRQTLQSVNSFLMDWTK